MEGSGGNPWLGPTADVPIRIVQDEGVWRVAGAVAAGAIFFPPTDTSYIPVQYEQVQTQAVQVQYYTDLYQPMTYYQNVHVATNIAQFTSYLAQGIPLDQLLFSTLVPLNVLDSGEVFAVNIASIYVLVALFGLMFLLRKRRS